MSERLAVLARHLASGPDQQEQQQRITSAMPTSSPLSLSPSQQQLGAFCPRELSRFMTHDNHELRERIQEFLKVSFEAAWWCRERGEEEQREPMARRPSMGSASLINLFDGAASFLHVLSCLSSLRETVHNVVSTPTTRGEKKNEHEKSTKKRAR